MHTGYMSTDDMANDGEFGADITQDSCRKRKASDTEKWYTERNNGDQAPQQQEKVHNAYFQDKRIDHRRVFLAILVTTLFILLTAYTSNEDVREYTNTLIRAYTNTTNTTNATHTAEMERYNSKEDMYISFRMGALIELTKNARHDETIVPIKKPDFAQVK
jgi:hypothetical protein